MPATRRKTIKQAAPPAFQVNDKVLCQRGLFLREAQVKEHKLTANGKEYVYRVKYFDDGEILDEWLTSDLVSKADDEAAIRRKAVLDKYRSEDEDEVLGEIDEELKAKAEDAKRLRMRKKRKAGAAPGGAAASAAQKRRTSSSSIEDADSDGFNLKLEFSEYLKEKLRQDHTRITVEKRGYVVPSARKEHSADALLVEFQNWQRKEILDGEDSSSLSVEKRRELELLENFVAGIRQFFNESIIYCCLYEFERNSYVFEKGKDKKRSHIETFNQHHLLRFMTLLPELLQQFTLHEAMWQMMQRRSQQLLVHLESSLRRLDASLAASKKQEVLFVSFQVIDCCGKDLEQNLLFLLPFMLAADRPFLLDQVRFVAHTPTNILYSISIVDVQQEVAQGSDTAAQASRQRIIQLPLVQQQLQEMIAILLVEKCAENDGILESQFLSVTGRQGDPLDENEFFVLDGNVLDVHPYQYVFRVMLKYQDYEQAVSAVAAVQKEATSIASNDVNGLHEQKRTRKAQKASSEQARDKRPARTKAKEASRSRAASSASSTTSHERQRSHSNGSSSVKPADSDGTGAASARPRPKGKRSNPSAAVDDAVTSDTDSGTERLSIQQERKKRKLGPKNVPYVSPVD